MTTASDLKKLIRKYAAALKKQRAAAERYAAAKRADEDARIEAAEARRIVDMAIDAMLEGR